MLSFAIDGEPTVHSRTFLTEIAIRHRPEFAKWHLATPERQSDHKREQLTRVSPA
jgi:hypothetical protein